MITDKEAPTVAARTPQEVEAFRAEKQMRVQGVDVPKPVITFDEAGFPSISSLSPPPFFTVASLGQLLTRLLF